jgi:hypothetical protein
LLCISVVIVSFVSFVFWKNSGIESDNCTLVLHLFTCAMCGFILEPAWSYIDEKYD